MQVTRQTVPLLRRSQLLARLEDVLELRGHAVELPCKLPYLVLRSIVGRCREVPATPTVCRGEQSLQPARQAARDQVPKGQTRQAGDRRDDHAAKEYDPQEHPGELENIGPDLFH